MVFADELTVFIQELRALGVKASIIKEFQQVSKMHVGTAESIGLDKLRVFPPGTGKLDAMRLMMYEPMLLAHLTVLKQKATGSMPSYSHLLG